MQRKNVKLSTLKKVMKKCPQTAINIKVTAEGKLRFYTNDKIKSAIEKAEKLLGNGGRIVVRPSGTEPLVRVMAEGDDEKLIKEAAGELARTIEKELS